MPMCVVSMPWTIFGIALEAFSVLKITEEEGLPGLIRRFANTVETNAPLLFQIPSNVPRVMQEDLRNRLCWCMNELALALALAGVFDLACDLLGITVHNSAYDLLDSRVLINACDLLGNTVLNRACDLRACTSRRHACPGVAMSLHKMTCGNVWSGGIEEEGGMQEEAGNREDRYVDME
jgi:hypothetical protein